MQNGKIPQKAFEAYKFNVTQFSDDKGLTSSIDIVVNYLEHVFIFLLSANEHQELKL